MTFHGLPCWYELATSDPKAAEDFYAAVLGWTWTDSGTPGMTYMLASIGKSSIAGMMAAEPGQPQAWSIYTAVDSADATAALAESLGARVIVPPSDIPGTGRFAILTDPQGAAFGILQPLPMADGSTGGGAFDLQKNGHGNWNELVSTDAEAAMAFYGKLFGWTVSRRMEMGPGMTYLIFARDGTDIGGAFSAPGAPFWKPYFGVESCKDAAGTLTARGGRVTRGPDQVPGGAFTLQVTDPQGVALALVGKP